MKRIISAVLAISLFVSMVVYAQEPVLMNVAKGKIVTHWSTRNATPEDTMNLTDSLVNTNVFVNIGDTSWSHEEKYTVSFQIDLTQSCNVTGLTLTPILDKPAGNCFPKRFQIQISDDASFTSYTVLHDQAEDYYTDLYTLDDWKNTNMQKEPTGPRTKQDFEVTGFGRYIRIYVTKNATYAPEVVGQKGQCGSGFAEIEVWAPRGAVLTKCIPQDAKVWSEYKTDQLSGASLIDNDYSTYNETNCGDTSWARADQYKAFFLVDLGKSREIAQVKLMPRVVPYGGTFPQQFEIQVSDDEDFATYDVVYSQITDYYENTNIWKDSTSPAKIPVGPTTEQNFDVTGFGRYVRICATKHAAVYLAAGDGKGYIRTAFGEISIYTTAVCELENTYYDQNGEEITGNSLNGVTELTVETVIHNETRAADEGILIYAIYNNGIMKHIEFEEIDISAVRNEQEPKTLNLSFDGGEYEVRTFLWVGRDNISPLCDSLVFPQK
jgi:hypothetical protein